MQTFGTAAYTSQDQFSFLPQGRVITHSNTSRADMVVVEGPSELTLQPISSLGKQSQPADPEGASIGDGENPEFKLPKMSSLVVVLLTNVFMQVLLCSLSRANLVDLLPGITRYLFSSSSPRRACMQKSWEAARLSPVLSSVFQPLSQPWPLCLC